MASYPHFINEEIVVENQVIQLQGCSKPNSCLSPACTASMITLSHTNCLSSPSFLKFKSRQLLVDSVYAWPTPSSSQAKSQANSPKDLMAAVSSRTRYSAESTYHHLVSGKRIWGRYPLRSWAGRVSKRDRNIELNQ